VSRNAPRLDTQIQIRKTRRIRRRIGLPLLPEVESVCTIRGFTAMVSSRDDSGLNRDASNIKFSPASSNVSVERLAWKRFRQTSQ
jgi:hypothetical protein